MQKYKESIQIYEILLKECSNCENQSLYDFELGFLNFLIQDYSKAIPYFNASLTSNFNSSLSHYYLSQIYLIQNNLSKTNFHLRKSLQNAPQFLKTKILNQLIQIENSSSSSNLIEWDIYHLVQTIHDDLVNINKYEGEFDQNFLKKHTLDLISMDYNLKKNMDIKSFQQFLVEI